MLGLTASARRIGNVGKHFWYAIRVRAKVYSHYHVTVLSGIKSGIRYGAGVNRLPGGPQIPAPEWSGG